MNKDEKSKLKVVTHADDFGVIAESTEIFLDLLQKKAIDEISIVSNCLGFQDSIAELNSYLKDQNNVKIWGHLNLIEGNFINLNPISKEPSNFFPSNFYKLFVINYFSSKKKKHKISLQIAEEFDSQINVLKSNLYPVELYGIDSHMHLHCIPIVWNEYEKLAKQHNLKMRVPSERLYLSDPIDLVRFTYLIGIIKNIVLKVLNSSNIGKHESNFVGVIYSGEMTAKRAIKGLDKFSKVKNEFELRVLFHPGKPTNMHSSSQTSRKLRRWYGSRNRHREYSEAIKFLDFRKNT